MATLINSYKLNDLFDRIEEKDGFDQAVSTFEDVADHCGSNGDSLEELVELGTLLTGDEYWSVEVSNPDDADEDRIFLFLADKTHETNVYNRVLRQWCEDTGRKVKSA